MAKSSPEADLLADLISTVLSFLSSTLSPSSTVPSRIPASLSPPRILSDHRFLNLSLLHSTRSSASRFPAAHPDPARACVSSLLFLLRHRILLTPHDLVPTSLPLRTIRSHAIICHPSLPP
eukprot:767557-Hanusia_phi.AAC.2